ncbi:uncharacterized protein LOC125248174 isoform X2 [Megalobrama amblycephala]|uniref:uncharacterized protein LOC125248174 isoform X2 n=1 Tax=Megalobrama amblycephala TaxID=75352 RepID=UPI0020141F0B|nr:uncharacterized protein LOC125248174 isoform X2 [Megalobrama amblycephala]
MYCILGTWKSVFKESGISGGVSSDLRSAAVKMVFVKEESEEDMNEPESWRIKHEEQGGLVKVKEEREDLMEVEEKHQHQKDHDVPGEESDTYKRLGFGGKGDWPTGIQEVGKFKEEIQGPKNTKNWLRNRCWRGILKKCMRCWVPGLL